MTDDLAFNKVMAVLAATYPRMELTPETLTAYHAILGDLPPDLLKAATLHLAATSKWFPAASEIRATAFELVEREAGVPDAYQAWAEVLQNMRTGGGAYSRPEWSHPAIGATVEAVGGYRYLCHSENAVADRARFVEAFRVMLKRERATVRMLPAVAETIAKAAGLLAAPGVRRLTDAT